MPQLALFVDVIVCFFPLLPSLS